MTEEDLFTGKRKIVAPPKPGLFKKKNQMICKACSKLSQILIFMAIRPVY